MNRVPFATFNLDSVEEGLCIHIHERVSGTLFDAGENAGEYIEARYQVVEGCEYDYEISVPGYFLSDTGQNIVQQHKSDSRFGKIAPNIYVGTLTLTLLNKTRNGAKHLLEIEVQSVKTGYRSDYQDMLRYITEKSAELLLHVDSPVSQYYQVDYSKDSKSLYQSFAFIRSIVESDSFNESIQRILTHHVTRWTEIEDLRDVRNFRRFTSANIKQIIRGDCRNLQIGSDFVNGLSSYILPRKLTSKSKFDTVDTHENRFVKNCLEVYLNFAIDVNSRAKSFKYRKLELESSGMIHFLEEYLNHTFFKEIQADEKLNINSPVLQRKEGYREVLRTWLLYGLAAKLTWKGAEDFYSAGKKDVATLYEYWLFFKLLDLFQSIFSIKSNEIKDLFTVTADGLTLNLKQGKFIALQGEYLLGTRKMNIRFSYNRSFNGKQKHPNPGSWSLTLRPDYTLSLWPTGISEEEAEYQELIVHVHFDAKYRVSDYLNLLDARSEIDLENEKIENRKGVFRNADILKMHAYKDAIRRTGGAYVLYPGGKSMNQRGFHEIIPGLGAFAVNPQSGGGLEDLKSFIIEIIDHFVNRSSQREKMALRTYDLYKTPPDPENMVNENLPEPYNGNRDLIPDEIFVVVGEYASDYHYGLIKNKGVYNFRISTSKAYPELNKETVGARYMLLYCAGETKSGELWMIKSKGPRIVSIAELGELGDLDSAHTLDLVMDIEPVSDAEFKELEWSISQLKSIVPFRSTSFQFTVSLSTLMKCRID